MSVTYIHQLTELIIRQIILESLTELCELFKIREFSTDCSRGRQIFETGEVFNILYLALKLKVRWRGQCAKTCKQSLGAKSHP